MNFLKKYWPTIAAALGAAVPFLMPSLLSYVQLHPHTAVGVLLAAVIAAYHATAPKDKDPDAAAQGPNQAAMKAIAVGLLILAFAHPSFAQDSITNLYGAGVSYNNAGHPAIAGTAFFAKSINDGSGTFAFTAVDALPNTLKPFTVTTNISTGIAQKLFTIGKISMYAPVTAGLSWQGSNVGWAWSGGGIVPVKVKGSWYLVSSLRFAKSSVSNGTGYQLIPGIAVAWGQ